MKKQIFMNFVTVLFLAIFIISISGVSVFAADSPNAKLLSIADVEKVTGIQGLKMVPKDPSKHMIGDLNFVKPDGKRLLSIVFEIVDLKAFAQTKQSSSFKSLYSGPVKGIGDEAFDGPPKMTPYYLSVRKGTHWITISTSLDVSKGMKPILTQEQLKKITEIIIKNGKW
ncbi:MAG: hypothetical protein ABSA44_02170 [Bacteroidota bacterium]|jgi:hypothetical protein